MAIGGDETKPKDKPPAGNTPTSGTDKDKPSPVATANGDPCPGPVYIGTGTQDGVDIVLFSDLRSSDVIAKAKKAAQDEAMSLAYSAAAADAKSVAQPDCNPCTCVLSITFASSEVRSVEVSTLPDDAPQKAKDKLKEYKADKIETLYIATVTWVAWWVCTKGDGIPVKPPANPGSGASTWVGGSEKKFPCPHPFFSGKGDASIKFVQSELHPATADHFATEKAAAEKAVPEEAEKKTKAEVEEAIKKLPQCPPDCPQASPLSIQIGPSGKKDASHAGGPAGSGDETCDIEFWYYWSVERNCAAGH